MLEKEMNANETLKEAVKEKEEKINDYAAIYHDNREERRKLIEDIKATKEIKGQLQKSLEASQQAKKDTRASMELVQNDLLATHDDHGTQS